MGVYIDMEMPKAGQIIEIAGGGTGTIYARISPGFDKWHPIIPVPLHGRLVDADALKKKRHWTDDFYETEYVEVEDIDAAPTIIPAEGGET